jgi:hypothetical protein
MAGKNTSVVGIYSSREAVERAVSSLRDAGFRSLDISVLFPANVGSKDFAYEKGTKAPEGATTGGGTGAVIGGALGWLAGIGALAIPGVGPFIAAGPIMAALAGGAVGGAVGGLTGALIGMGIPEYEAKRYEGRVQKGGILLSVHSDDSVWARLAKEVLERTGAEDISSTSEAPGDYQNSDRPMPRASV